MSDATLLHVPDNRPGKRAFAFEHMMAHRELFGTMAAVLPATTFSVLPYLLDPTVNTGKWHLNHGTAHHDFIGVLPSYFGVMETGLPTGQPLRDVNLDNREQRTWWTFTNHQEHVMASYNSQGLDQIFPFW